MLIICKGGFSKEYYWKKVYRRLQFFDTKINNGTLGQ